MTGIIGGFGAMFSVLFIFRFVKFSFKDECLDLKQERISKKIKSLVNKIIGKKIRKGLLYIFACILIASPLPDEIGVTMLAELTRIKANVLAIIGFILCTLGIIAILGMGRLI